MVQKKKMEGKEGKESPPKWILRLNPKGQTTIPLKVRRALGIGGETRELELVYTLQGFYLRPHKPPLPIHEYIGYCADELGEIEDPVTFVRELRGRSNGEAEE